jgi:hypothetical protein
MREWRTCKVKLADLVAWADNPNVMNEKQGRGLQRSLSRFGMAEPVVVSQADKHGKRHIIGGHHRITELQRLGETEVLASEPVGKDLTENQRIELGLRLNHDRGELDLALALNLPEIVLEEVGIDLSTTPDDPVAEWEGMPEFNHGEIRGNALCCLVRFKTESDRTKFEKLLGYKLHHKNNTFTTWFPKADFDQLGRGKEFASES